MTSEAAPSRRACLALGAAAAVGAVGAPARGAEPAAGPDLKLGVTPSPRTWPLMGGEVSLPGISYAVTALSPSELFFRQLRDAEFDASEMSISSLMIAMSRGDRRFIPLPIFTSRYFFHSLTLVRRDAGIRRPQDLKGKRVGLPEYQMTGALWTRGVFQDEFGLRPADIDWWIERLPRGSHAGALGITPPAGIPISQIPPEKNIGAMMLAGELDAAVMYFPTERPTTTERSTAKLLGHPDIATLFPDPQAENARYYAKTGIHHINHCAVIKRDLVARRPELRRAVLDLFDQANDLADKQRLEHVEYHYETGLIDAAARRALTTHLVKYGVAENRRTLETLARYSFEQGFTPQRVDIDAFFADV